jgi:GAF domain-containing protein
MAETEGSFAGSTAVMGGADALSLAQHLAEMTATRSREALCEAACRASGELLGLDRVWMVCRRRGRVGAEHEWMRPGARSQRLGDARFAELLENVESGSAAVSHHWAGRVTTLAVPVVVGGRLESALVGSARGELPVSTAMLELARALSLHAGSCLELILMAGSTGEPARIVAEPAPPSEPSPLAPPVGPLDMLQAVSQALVGANSETAVGETVVAELRRLIDYHSCRFYVLSADGETLLPIALRGYSEVYSQDVPDDLVVAVGEGVTGTCFAEARPMRIDDGSKEQAGVEIPGTTPMDESMLLAPMMADSGPLGVIVLTKEGLACFTDADLRLLEIVAAQAAAKCEGLRLAVEQRDAAEVSEALLDLGAALAAQTSVERIAHMLAAGVDRLMDAAGISIWLREREELVPASLVGYTPRERERLMSTRVPVRTEPFASALASRRLTVSPVDEAPVLAGCLDAAPAGTTFAIVAVGERAANRAAIVVQRGPRRGAPSRRDERLLLGVADQALLAMTNRALVDQLQTSFLATVEALGNALDLKDQYTNDHALALVGLCTAVAERLGLDEAGVRDVSFAAALHDIGKIGIPQEVLNKPGRLTAEEFELMKLHPELGARIIEPVPALAGARRLVIACHEHWDGGGYPRGLAGDEIPLGARVILACDAFHAMTSDRVYRPAMTKTEAIAELRRGAGTQFEPRVVDALVAVVAESERVSVA